jgi:hypothetical protein
MALLGARTPYLLSIGKWGFHTCSHPYGGCVKKATMVRTTVVKTHGRHAVLTWHRLLLYSLTVMVVSDSKKPKLIRASKATHLKTRSNDLAASISCSTAGIWVVWIMSIEIVFIMIALIHVLFGWPNSN